MPEFKFTPILMLTTESQQEKKVEGKAAGATGWIVKPFNPEQLLQVVGKVVR
jgi:two-component system chemotaxis response regulator CheY